MDCKILYLITNKNEFFAFGDAVSRYPIGTFIKYLLESNDSFWDNVERIVDETSSLCSNEHKLLYIPSAARSFGILNSVNKEIDASYANGLLKIIETTKKITTLNCSRLLKESVLLLPAYTCYVNAQQKSNAVSPSAERRAKNTHNIHDLSRSREETALDAKENHDMNSEEGDEVTKTQLWRDLISYLTGDINYASFVYYINSRDDRNALLDTIMEYCECAKRLCKEAKKLRQDIPIALGLRESNYLTVDNAKKALKDNVGGAIPVWQEEGSRIFGDSYERNTPIFSVTSLTALAVLSLDFCSRYDYKFKACKCCGRLFATRKENQKYCEYPNPALGGKTCKVGAPYNTYWHGNELLKEYRKSYASYNRWRNRVITDDDSKQHSYMRELEIYTVRNYGQEIWEKLNRKIKDETRISFSAWNEKALGSLDQFDEGNISKKECQAALSLPSIEARSSILAYIEKDRYRIDTDYLENLGIIKKK